MFPVVPSEPAHLLALMLYFLIVVWFFAALSAEIGHWWAFAFFTALLNYVQATHTQTSTFSNASGTGMVEPQHAAHVATVYRI